MSFTTSLRHRLLAAVTLSFGLVMGAVEEDVTWPTAVAVAVFVSALLVLTAHGAGGRRARRTHTG